MNETLVEALQISGIGIVVLLLVLLLLAGIVSLMTKFIVDKPEKELADEEEDSTEKTLTTANSDLEMVAAVAVALARAQAETQSKIAPLSTGEINAWRQFHLQRKLTQSSTIRRTR